MNIDDFNFYDVQFNKGGRPFGKSYIFKTYGEYEPGDVVIVSGGRNATVICESEKAAAEATARKYGIGGVKDIIGKKVPIEE